MVSNLEREKMLMDTSLEALYTSQISATQTTATVATKNETSTDTTFADLLAAMSGSQSSMQQYLLNGLMDGSLNVSDSSNLVSALLGTVDSESTAGNLLSYDALSGDSMSGLSSDILKTLLELGQDSETDWLTQILQAYSSNSTEDGTDDGNATLQAYYQAQAAMMQAQMGMGSE